MSIRRPYEGVVSREPVLGTMLDVQLTARSRRGGQRTAQLLLAEIERLENIFSVYRDRSELVAFRRGEQRSSWSEELCVVLDLAAQWHVVGRGAFNPTSGLLSRRWQQAEREQIVPSTDELRELAHEAASPTYRVHGRAIERLGDVSALNLNAFAKGWIAQRAARLAWDTGVLERLVVNAGGDLVHIGAGSVRVGIEDPIRPYDNADPHTWVRLSNAGLATSGSSRRGFEIGDRWFSHVIDPRTGWPVEHVLSASVIAPDAATADVVATLASVLAPEETLALCASAELDPLVGGAELLGVCIVAHDGWTHTNTIWDRATAQRRP